jgi:hypothetical protein
MHQAAEAFPIRPPTQVGGGINGALGGLAKHIRRTVRQDAVQQAAQFFGLTLDFLDCAMRRFCYAKRARSSSSSNSISRSWI